MKKLRIPFKYIDPDKVPKKTGPPELAWLWNDPSPRWTPLGPRSMMWSYAWSLASWHHKFVFFLPLILVVTGIFFLLGPKSCYSLVMDLGYNRKVSGMVYDIYPDSFCKKGWCEYGYYVAEYNFLTPEGQRLEAKSYSYFLPDDPLEDHETEIVYWPLDPEISRIRKLYISPFHWAMLTIFGSILLLAIYAVYFMAPVHYLARLVRRYDHFITYGTVGWGTLKALDETKHKLEGLSWYRATVSYVGGWDEYDASFYVRGEVMDKYLKLLWVREAVFLLYDPSLPPDAFPAEFFTHTQWEVRMNLEKA